MDIDLLYKTLQEETKLKLFLKVKEYKSTFISTLKSRYEIKISLHSLFLKAPKEIIDAISSHCFRRDKDALKVIRNYASNYFKSVDYSDRLDVSKLVSKGNCYDLKQIFDVQNQIYFHNELKALNITYFQKPKYRRYRHFTFGSYDKNLKLIRINKLLDNSKFPFYFINYIVYHEILHHIYPVILDKNGRRKVHTKEFKTQEKKFPYYREAIEFEKKFLKKG